jgi:hypothetical protein
VIGLTIGAVSSAGGDGYERCMAGKGYRRPELESAPASAQQAEAPPLPHKPEIVDPTR